MKSFRLAFVVMIMLFTFVQPRSQSALGEDNKDHHIDHISAQQENTDSQADVDVLDWWKTERVISTKQFSEITDRNLRLDAQGHPHIAYGGLHLYYARYDGVEWHYETVDDSYDVGSSASLVLDEYGYPHISYLGEAGLFDYFLKYAYQDVEGWHIQIIESSDIAGQSNSLALDSEGRPHISYVSRYSDTGLSYAYLDTNGWQIETLDRYASFGNTSLALDGYDLPHISYSSNGGVTYVYNDSIDWNFQFIDGNGSTSSLTLDGDGYPHISYVNYSSVYYAFQDEDGWHKLTVDSEGKGDPTLVLDEDGNPHISYSWLYFESNQEKYNLVYVYSDGEEWHSQTVGLEGEAGIWSSLILDQDGYPHISSGGHPDYPFGFSNLMYIYMDTNGWHSQVVDSEGAVGEYSSLALDGLDNPHIIFSHNGVDAGGLMYAHKDMTGWIIEQLDSSGTVQGNRTIVLDDDDYPHIVYFSNDGLIYAHQDADGWSSDMVYNTNGEVVGSSLALDQDGYPHISICLNYIYRDIGGWHTEYAGGTGSFGSSLVLDAYGNAQIGVPFCGSSLALDAYGNAHIGVGFWYGDYTYAEWGIIKYAHKDITGWDIDQVDDKGSEYLSLALDMKGSPHLSYYNASPDPSGINGLQYSFKDNDGWYVETLDSGWVGKGNYLVLDEAGYPHISYVTSGLKYAYEDLDGWNISTVHSTPGCYQDSTSLTLDSAGHPHISYIGCGDLWYTYNMGDYQATYLPLVVK